MRAVVQRVLSAGVDIGGAQVAGIGYGALILAGFAKTDTFKDFEYIAKKCAELRIFDDDYGVMNRSLEQTGAETLIVSQFTLYGDVRKGRRPSYFDAASPADASAMFIEFVGLMKKRITVVQTGVFGADMRVSLVNDGPVTILLDSDRRF